MNQRIGLQCVHVPIVALCCFSVVTVGSTYFFSCKLFSSSHFQNIRSIIQFCCLKFFVSYASILKLYDRLFLQCDALLIWHFMSFVVKVDGWTEIQKDLDKRPYSQWFTVIFIFLGHFIFTNLFIGIIIMVSIKLYSRCICVLCNTYNTSFASIHSYQIGFLSNCNNYYCVNLCCTCI